MLALKGSPTALLPLFVTGEHLLVSTPAGEELRALAPAFVARSTGRAFLGYLTNQRRGLTGERHATRTRELSKLHGYDTKYAMHALRIAYQGIELLSTGRITLPVPEPERVRAARACATASWRWTTCWSAIDAATVQLEELAATPRSRPSRRSRAWTSSWCGPYRAAWDYVRRMNGAESVLRTLAASGVDVCFANPGTSEMHLVAAMDRVPEVRGVLTLFEGVASAAADGYARMAGKPAATLLHLGPGFGNAFANVHNAYKGRTPMVNLVGDHAILHRPLGAPLTSDVEAIAGPASHWLRSARDAREAATLAAEAVAAARRGGVATLVLPADAGLGREPRRRGARAPGARAAGPRRGGGDRRAGAALRPRRDPARRRRPRATRGLRRRRADRRRHGRRGVPRHVHAAARPRRRTRPRARLLPYLTELAVDALAEFEQLIVVGTRPPVGFFAYPGKPSLLWSPETQRDRARDAGGGRAGRAGGGRGPRRRRARAGGAGCRARSSRPAARSTSTR